MEPGGRHTAARAIGCPRPGRALTGADDAVSIQSLPEVTWAVRCIPSLRRENPQRRFGRTTICTTMGHWIFRSESDG